ncbi:MAG: gamma-glutamylcyclotransferase family protein [Chitinophagales bacterium]
MKTAPNSLPTCYLFDYGRLQRSFDNEMSDLVQRSFVYKGKAHFEGSLYDVGNFPAAIFAGRPEAKVHGELFRIPACEVSLVDLLDEYKGCPELCDRILIEVTQDDGTIIDAMVYVYKHTTQNLNPIDSGNYREYCEDTVKTKDVRY